MAKAKKLKSGNHEINGVPVPEFLLNYQGGGIKLPTLPERSMNPYQTGQTDVGNMDYKPMSTDVGPESQLKRQFDPMRLNAWGAGLIGAYLGSRILNNKVNENNYDDYKRRWIRDYNIPSLIQDPTKFGSQMYEFQKGGTMPPVYTNDPKDPRLKAYNDSLMLYNQGVEFNEIIKNSGNYYPNPEKSEIPKNRLSSTSSKFIADPRNPIVTKRVSEDFSYPTISDNPAKIKLNSVKGIQPIQSKTYTHKSSKYKSEQEYVEASKRGDNSEYNWIGYSVFDYKNPVQPVIYRPQNMSGKPKTVFPENNLDLGQVPINPSRNLPLRDLSQPTGYSITVPTFDDPLGQTTINYPDLESWRKAKDKIRLASSQESGDGKSATATGYLKSGGILNELQGGGTIYTKDKSDDKVTNISKLSSSEKKELVDAYKEIQQMEKKADWTNPKVQERLYEINRIYDKYLPRKTFLAEDGSEGTEWSFTELEDFRFNRYLTNLPKKRTPAKRAKPEPRTARKGPDVNYAPTAPVLGEKTKIAEQQKTPYSITYPTFDENVQSSLYFPTAESWRKNLGMFRNVSSQESKNGATATGYLKYGGKKQRGGLTLNTPEQQAAGYYAYPDASSLTFPGVGPRTFIPGPFPLLIQDEKGTQIMTNKPVKTYGTVKEIPLFECGGEVKIRTNAPIVDRDEATIEAQKGELIFGAGSPGDIKDQEDRVGVGLYKIGGKLHSQGGTPLKAFPGDFVFSNETELAPSEEDAELIVGRKIKKVKQRTPAKLASNYMDLNKYLAMVNDKEADDTIKKTAILNINNFIDRLAEVAYHQEEKKGFPDGVPDFVQASLDARFNSEGLQEQLNTFKYGGQIPKHQTKGMVTEEEMRRARLVNEVPEGYNFYSNMGFRDYYLSPGETGVKSKAPKATKFETDAEKLLRTYGTRKTNPLNSYSYDDLLQNKYIGQDTPALRSLWDQFYRPLSGNELVYTRQAPGAMYSPTPVNIDLGPRPAIGGRPNLPVDRFTPTEKKDDSSITEIPNSKFDMNLAEAAGLFMAGIPSESRYPTAFRNYEIQNAKAQIANTGRPISDQPYLNAIQRQSLGFDQNNNPFGAAGVTRSLGAFQAGLTASNEAISQVYNQNIARADQRAQQLAQLEIQDGVDRITNAERYDTKLETLANNKELERQNRYRNITRQINQMQSDRESKALLNQMSMFHQINRDGSIGMKPTYTIENGKLVPHQRTVADLVRGQAPNTTQFSPAVQLAQQLEAMGYDRQTIGRILSRAVDDYDRQQSK